VRGEALIARELRGVELLSEGSLTYREVKIVLELVSTLNLARILGIALLEIGHRPLGAVCLSTDVSILLLCRQTMRTLSTTS